MNGLGGGVRAGFQQRQWAVGHWGWLACGGLGVVALFVLGAQPFAVGLFVPPYDKVAHAAAFGLLFLVLDRALVLPLWCTALLPLLVSALDECHQFWLPGRQPDLGDWLAGACGVLVALRFREQGRA